MEKKLTKADLLYKESLLEKYFLRQLSEQEGQDFAQFMREDKGFAARVETEYLFLETLEAEVNGSFLRSFRGRIFMFFCLILLVVIFYLIANYEPRPQITEELETTIVAQVDDLEPTEDTIIRGPLFPSAPSVSTSKVRDNVPPPKVSPPKEAPPSIRKNKAFPSASEQNDKVIAETVGQAPVSLPPVTEADDSATKIVSIDLTDRAAKTALPIVPVSSKPRLIDLDAIPVGWQKIFTQTNVTPRFINNVISTRQKAVDRQLKEIYQQEQSSASRISRKTSPFERQDVVIDAYIIAERLKTHPQFGAKYEEVLRLFADKLSRYEGSYRQQILLLNDIKDLLTDNPARNQFVNQHIDYLLVQSAYVYGEFTEGDRRLKELKPDGNFFFPQRLRLLQAFFSPE